MAASCRSASCGVSVLSLTFDKCNHLKESKSIIAPVVNSRTFNDIFEEHHNFRLKNNSCRVMSQSTSYVITPALTVGEVVTLFNVRQFIFMCEGGAQGEKDTLPSLIKSAAEKADMQAVNAFQILMAGGRTLPHKKTTSAGLKDGISRKDELFNDLVDEFKTRKLDFPKAIADTDGTYFIQVICNALWYITDKQTTINDAALRYNHVSPVPPPFDQYTGYNNTKRKKIKSQPLSSGLLKSHAEALFSLLEKPFMNSSPAWKGIGEKLELLAECFLGYKKYLDGKARESEENRTSDHPVRTVDKHATVEHRKGSLFVKSKYSIIEKDVKEAGELNPVIFDESKHLENSFENNSQRYRFFNELQLSFPVLVDQCSQQFA